MRETGETATLSAPGEHDAVTIDFAHSSSVVQSVAQLGRPSVGHATAAGKVMLAFGDVELPARPLAAFTPRTITTLGRLVEELERVRRRGLRRGPGGAGGRTRGGRGARRSTAAASSSGSSASRARLARSTQRAARAAATSLLEHTAAVSIALGWRGAGSTSRLTRGYAGSQTRHAARSRIRFVSFA